MVPFVGSVDSRRSRHPVPDDSRVNRRRPPAGEYFIAAPGFVSPLFGAIAVSPDLDPREAPPDGIADRSPFEADELTRSQELAKGGVRDDGQRLGQLAVGAIEPDDRSR